MDDYKEWIGREIIRSDIITPRLVEHFKKTLEPNLRTNDQIPEGLFLCLCPDVVDSDKLSGDGNSKLGIFLPDLPYKIRMWAGGKITIFDQFQIGWEIKKISKIEKIDFKKGQSGNLCFVTINHDYKFENRIIINEQQTAVYREKINNNLIMSKKSENIKVIDEFNIFGSSTLLFRYSALTFNGHKIHYDIDYTKNVEGHSGLLVHAPLQATYLLNIAKKNNINFNSFEYKATFPLVANKKFTVQLGKNNQDDTIGLVLNHKKVSTMKAIFK